MINPDHFVLLPRNEEQAVIAWLKQPKVQLLAKEEVRTS
jgi:hypothetical protein